MMRTSLLGRIVVLGLVLAAPAAAQKESRMARAAGTFEVKLSPQPLADPEAGPLMARLSLEKQLQGDLQGTSRGEMLSAGNPKEGSAGYVAMERVIGTLQGKKGSFALQHSGTMDAGQQHLEITVVPGSGTGELTGLKGTMSIKIEGGKHSYELVYSLQ